MRIHVRRGLTAVAVAALIATLAPPALAARRVVIRGGGWGHGIGMSQYGAYGRARNGASAATILEHYYSGSRVASADMPGRVRVGLLQGRSAIGITTQPHDDGTGRVVWREPGVGRIAAGGPSVAWRVEPSSTGGMRLFADGERVKANGRVVFGDPKTPLVLVYEKHGTIVSVSDKPYRYRQGRLEFGTYDTSSCERGFCLRLVASLSMDKYLYGLGEVPASWPDAVLEAQAIAARTYALDKIERSGQHRFPCDCAVFDSTYDQAYTADSKRTGSGEYWDDWKGAVDSTSGRVVLYDGSPIQALYSSSSGGHTEHNENVWGGSPLPYLRGVPDDPDDVSANPNHTWVVEMSYRSFAAKLDDAYGIGALESFSLVRPFGVSGRVTVVKDDGSGGVRIRGSRKTVRVSGWSVRSALGLRDTLFRVEVQYDVGSRFAAAHRELDGAPGDPVSAPYAVPRKADRARGRAQDFERGRLTWIRSTDRVVWQRGVVLSHYDSLGRESSGLGMPRSGTWRRDGARGARYENGYILWSRATEAHTVRGDFADVYRATAAARGPLGLPVAERERAPSLPDGGRRQRFENGAIYRNPHSGDAVALWGAIADTYFELGEAESACGYPTGSVTAADGEIRAPFEHGTITWSEGSGAVVSC